ncbi:MAG: NifB/NifX family molybdenum-iron cluster-binding protein [Bacteroidetes bacterium]|nr:NifB/NifX family molybdenum-iron cluster-binding protein [Bacteroidota bacterium]
MTIAISATGEGWEDRIDERFGRARGFFLIGEDGRTRYLDNAQNIEAAHGAGTATVRMLHLQGVAVVITGRVGPKASDALEAADMHVFTADSGFTVRQAWDAYRTQQLQ